MPSSNWKKLSNSSIAAGPSPAQAVRWNSSAGAPHVIAPAPTSLALRGDMVNTLRIAQRTAAFLLISTAALVGVRSACADGCTSDLNADGLVDGADLGLLLSAWDNTTGPEDLNEDGLVDGADLGLLLADWDLVCSAAVTTQLGGRPLAVYPYFEYVRTFNVGAPVHVAVDPTRFPQVIDVEATIYVTAAKTAAEWRSDATLTDVRALGAQAVVFSGTDIQGNTFQVDTGTLAGDGGLDLSIGYDIVIDLNSNGVLDGGDLIDAAGGPDGTEPGIHVIKALTQSGPLAVSAKTWTVTGVTAGFTSQRVHHPTDIASMGKLPLVVISHGNGHQYTWYDYIGVHLASHGFITMSHQNNTGAGVEAASTTTLQHTQAIINLQATLGGGVLNGHIDADTIIWIGHSRGGEGIVRAYDRIFDGTFVPTNYSLDDIKLLSSIAPTDFLGTNSANPHSVVYHLLYGASDNDVCGCPDNDIADSFNLYERAAGPRQSHYLHGTGHNAFHTGASDDFAGPAGTKLTKAEVQAASKGVWLALIKHYIHGNIAAKDFLWRQYEAFRPVGVASKVIMDLDYNDGPDAEALEIDNFQTNTAIGTSSSGGAVTASVTNLVENKMNDGNTSFGWLTSDAFNGLVRGRTSDTQRNAVFDWDGAAFLEFEILPEIVDFTDFEFLQLRAAQGPRHPNTTAVIENLTFNLSLRDADGVTSTIIISAYGGGLQEPYQRTGFGTGAGWQTEMEVIRMRLTDFLHNGSGLDLSNIVAIRLDFGQPGTSVKGRVAFDDLRLTKD